MINDRYLAEVKTTGRVPRNQTSLAHHSYIPTGNNTLRVKTRHSASSARVPTHDKTTLLDYF